MKSIKFYLFFFIIIATGCRDNYELPLRDTDLSMLVVDGMLNAGQGPTTITLSKAMKTNEQALFNPVLQATLAVEGKDGGSFLLTENGAGKYSHPQLPLTIGQEYRLRIKTKENKEYLSDFVVAKQSPEIDGITWKKEKEGVMIYANTHDPSNNTRYYKWNFEETWEIRSYYTAFYRWVGGSTIVYSPIYNNRCWKYANSNTINIGSSTQLESDVISDAPLFFIAPGSERLGIRYSILLKQSALTKGAYEYLLMMKKNTENLGSIFDPQPSELKGNYRCVTNPAEGVVGYLTASSITEKRIFITAEEAEWRFSQSCEVERVPDHPDSIKLWVPGYLPFDKEEVLGVGTYFMAPARCVDCTARGGMLTKPSYW